MEHWDRAGRARHELDVLRRLGIGVALRNRSLLRSLLGLQSLLLGLLPDATDR